MFQDKQPSWKAKHLKERQKLKSCNKINRPRWKNRSMEITKPFEHNLKSILRRFSKINNFDLDKFTFNKI